MEKKNYKARVEMSFIVEVDVEACDESEVCEEAEEIARNDAKYVVENILQNPFSTAGYYVPNYEVTCIDVEECFEPN